MSIAKWIFAGSLLALGATAFQQDAWTAEPGKEAAAGRTALPQPWLRDRYRGVHPQLPGVATPIAVTYPRASSIGMAVVVVPDPLVPRYRRVYDLSIAALEHGMMKDGYVLDRFLFPWDEELRRSTDNAKPAGDNADVPDPSAGAYGLIVFRCDTWRGDACRYPEPAADNLPMPPAPAHFRALYVVRETATAGVDRHQLRCALRKVESQTSAVCLKPDASCPVRPEENDYSASATLLQYPGSTCRSGPEGALDVVLLGPNFSGSLDSIGSTVDGLFGRQHRRLCLIASAATDMTNRNVDKVYPNVTYRTTALEDHDKVYHIAQLAKVIGANFDQSHSRDVAILAETSTFGYGVCQRAGAPQASTPAEHEKNALVARFCASPKFYFPPTLADIRFGLQKQETEQANELAGAARRIENDQHLPLETGAENGSEFPESQQSAVTAAGNQLQLDQVFAALVETSPKLVLVAATDVRDRLFLFEQLREKLPRAMLVDLEADTLLTHPEFLHASRGALATASANLTARGTSFGCERNGGDTQFSWSTDSQGILAENVARLHEPDGDATASRTPCALSAAAGGVVRQAALQVVTFNGFMPVSYAFPQGGEPAGSGSGSGSGSGGDSAGGDSSSGGDSGGGGGPLAIGRPNFQLLRVTECLAVLFCVVLPWVWLWPWWLEQMSDDRRIRMLGGTHFEYAVLGFAALCCAPVFFLAFVVAIDSSTRSSHTLAYWVLILEAVGLLGLWRCYIQIRHTLWTANNRYYSSSVMAYCLSLVAVFFASTPLWMDLRAVRGPWVDHTLITALGFDPYSGLGFYLVVALTTLTVLYASAILATRTWVVRRNFHLMCLAASRVKGAIPFVEMQPTAKSPRWPSSAMLEDGETSAPHGYHPLPMWIFFVINAFVILVLALPGLLDQLGGPRLTVFGPFAARIAVLALSATTLCAATLVVGVFGAGRRITMLSGYVRNHALVNLPKAPPSDSGEILNPWQGGAEMPILFPATPVLARVGASGAFRRGMTSPQPAGALKSQQIGDAWAKSLSEILFKGQWDSTHRLALYALLAAEVSLFRWIALGAVVCSLVGVSIAYLYPIEADTLLIVNLLLLAVAGVMSAYLAVRFECDEVLSYVLCNRPKKPQISIGLFTYIASPFAALAAAGAIIGIPGVVDWAGGLLAMLRAVGIHG